MSEVAVPIAEWVEKAQANSVEAQAWILHTQIAEEIVAASRYEIVVSVSDAAASVAHRRHAPEFRDDLDDHRAEMRLIGKIRRQHVANK